MPKGTTISLACLRTGRIINRAHATQLPMPDDVIDRVHALARRQKANPGLVFLNRNQVPDGTINKHDNEAADDDDSDYIPGNDDDDGSVSEQDDDDDFDSDDDSDYYPPEDGREDDTDSLDYDSEDESIESKPKHPPGGGDDDEPMESGEIHPNNEDRTTGVDTEMAEVGRTTGVDAEVAEDPDDNQAMAEDGRTAGVDAGVT
jgi:hypothetical protein